MKEKKVINIINWILVVAFTCAYASLIFNDNLVTDEAFTMQLLKGGIKDIITGTASDVHPPLYYLYAKVFYKIFGMNFQVQKFAAIIPMTLTFVVGAVSVKKYFNELAALLFNLFLFCLPCTMEFAVQIRMYSLSLFFVTLCGVYAYAAFKEGKAYQYALMVIGAAGAAYSHYFAFAAVIFINGFLLIATLIWKRNKKSILGWVLASIMMIVLYLPWFPYFIHQVTAVETGYWIPRVTIETIWGYFTWTFDLELVPGTVYVFLGILLAMGIYNIVLLVKNGSDDLAAAVFSILVPICTCLGGVILSVVKTPIYRDQYILPALGCLALFYGIIMCRTKKPIIIVTTIFLLLVGGAQYKEIYDDEYNSTLLPQTLAYMSENFDEDDIIIYNMEKVGFIYKCYFPESQTFYIGEFDFSGDYDNVYFFCTDTYGYVQQAYIDYYQLDEEDVGRFGIEQLTFEIYRYHKRGF